MDKAHKAIKEIRTINIKLNEFESNFSELNLVADLILKSKELREKLSNIENILYQTQNRSNQDPLNFPIKLTNKLGHLNRLVTLNDFPPTDQDNIVKLELTEKVENQLKTFKLLIKNDVKNFNKAFAKLELDYLKLD